MSDLINWMFDVMNVVDHLHCCPSGYQCDVEHDRCKKNDDEQIDLLSIIENNSRRFLQVQSSSSFSTIECSGQRMNEKDQDSCFSS